MIAVSRESFCALGSRPMACGDSSLLFEALASQQIYDSKASFMACVPGAGNSFPPLRSCSTSSERARTIGDTSSLRCRHSTPLPRERDPSNSLCRGYRHHSKGQIYNIGLQSSFGGLTNRVAHLFFVIMMSDITVATTNITERGIRGWRNLRCDPLPPGTSTNPSILAV